MALMETFARLPGNIEEEKKVNSASIKILNQFDDQHYNLKRFKSTNFNYFLLLRRIQGNLNPSVDLVLYFHQQVLILSKKMTFFNLVVKNPTNEN